MNKWSGIGFLDPAPLHNVVCYDDRDQLPLQLYAFYPDRRCLPDHGGSIPNGLSLGDL